MNKVKNVIGVVGAVLLLCCVSACAMFSAKVEDLTPKIDKIEETATGVHIKWSVTADKYPSDGMYVILYYSKTNNIEDADEKILVNASSDFKSEGETDLTLSKNGWYYFWLSVEDKARKEQNTTLFCAHNLGA